MKYARPKYRRRRYVSKKRSMAPRKSFARKVRTVVTKMAEKKQTCSTLINNSLTTGDSGVLVPNIPLSPILSQGSAENGRIGNTVKVQYANISGYVNMLPYNATTNTFPNLLVKFYLVTYKNRNATGTNGQALTNSDLDTFFDSGSAGVPFQGTMFDILSPINTERFTVHATKVVNLSLVGSSSSYNNSTSPQIGNGNYIAHFSFNFGKHLGILKYDDTYGSNYPTNKNVYLLVQPVTSDGSSRQAGPIAELHYKYDVRYTDL